MTEREGRDIPREQPGKPAKEQNGPARQGQGDGVGQQNPSRTPEQGGSRREELK